MTAITSVWASDETAWGQGSVPGAESLLVAGTDFALDTDQPDGSSRSGIVYRLNGAVWHRPYVSTAGNLSASAPYPNGNVKVVYQAGFATVPGDVELATQMSVSRMANVVKTGAMLSAESTPGYSYTVANSSLGTAGNISLPAEAIAILASYREFPIG